MDDCEHVHSPVMNFLQNKWEEGIRDDIIIQHAIDFFLNAVLLLIQNMNFG